MTAMEKLMQVQRWFGPPQAGPHLREVPPTSAESRFDRLRRWSGALAQALDLLADLPGALEEEALQVEAHHEALSAPRWQRAGEEAARALEAFELAHQACRHLAAALDTGEVEHCHEASRLATQSEAALARVEAALQGRRQAEPRVA